MLTRIPERFSWNGLGITLGPYYYLGCPLSISRHLGHRYVCVIGTAYTLASIKAGIGVFLCNRPGGNSESMVGLLSRSIGGTDKLYTDICVSPNSNKHPTARVSHRLLVGPPTRVSLSGCMELRSRPLLNRELAINDIRGPPNRSSLFQESSNRFNGPRSARILLFDDLNRKGWG